MIGPTAAIAIFFSILVLMSRPGTALGLLIMSMLVWPENIHLPMGIASMSVPRLVAITLLIRLITQGRHRQANYCSVDTLVILVWLWTIIANLFAGAESKQVIWTVGRGLETTLMYFVARFSIFSAKDIKDTFFPLALTGIFMGGVGAIEAVTEYSPYRALEAYRNFVWVESAPEYRLGLLRAKGSLSIHIYYGVAMMVIAGMLLAFRDYCKSGFLWFIATVVAFLGAFSAMSSGPWIACFTLFFFLLYEKRTKFIKPTLWLILFFAAFLEVASNRHFYHLIDYLALNPATAWYRTKLIEVAFAQWQDFILIGIGSNSINHWAALIDGRSIVDVVNQFLMVALFGGGGALLMYIGAHVGAVKRAVRAWKISTDNKYKKMLFLISAAFLAVDLACMSVSLFGPPNMLLHILLGLVMSCSVAWQSQDDPQTVPTELPSEVMREIR